MALLDDLVTSIHGAVVNSHSVSGWDSLIPSDDEVPLAATEAGASRRLVHALAEGSTPPEPYTVRIFAPTPRADGPERPVTADQTNRSVIVGERVVVKWFLEPVPGARAPGLLGHLAEVGFRHTAQPYAALFWRDRLLALVTAFLLEARDGWAWCVDAVMAGGPEAGFATALGELAADLHAALATPSSSWPSPVTTVDGDGWHGRAQAAVAQAGARTTGQDGQWLEFRSAELVAGIRPLIGVGGTPVLRIHGDLHVGQVLKWRDGYAVIDFDGNPTLEQAEEPQPAARDVAQLLTSLENVAQIAIRRRQADPAAMAAWVRGARADLLSAYTSRLAGHGRSELLEPALLRPFEIEQECRELIYAARFLPRWTYAPMGVLRRWFG
jgi:maltokinase